MTHARSLLVLSLLVASAGPTFAYTPTSLTAAEAKCQQATAKAVGAGWARMTKCQAQCDKSALVGKDPASDAAVAIAIRPGSTNRSFMMATPQRSDDGGINSSELPSAYVIFSR